MLLESSPVPKGPRAGKTSLVCGDPNPERDGASNSSSRETMGGCVETAGGGRRAVDRSGKQGRTRKRRGAVGGFKARQTRDSTGRSGR
jgi:hypothetical protein